MRLLCTSLGWGVQTDKDTPVTQKSVLFSKPSDVKNERVFICLQSISLPSEKQQQTPYLHTLKKWTNINKSIQMQKVGT